MTEQPLENAPTGLCREEIYFFDSLDIFARLFGQILAWRKFGGIGDFGLKSAN